MARNRPITFDTDAYLSGACALSAEQHGALLVPILRNGTSHTIEPLTSAGCDMRATAQRLGIAGSFDWDAVASDFINAFPLDGALK